ncbi:hypothetical protein EZV62_014828 [Acer yangbiense]|uniref:Uncharacterized protein n=1 Tax=Acer yangbiense TaxID=1000413 RepID=A0A5C7HTU6_9ROSI|nr:hypothetical protein EZV62_014828 [Acer yangbiense]
MDSDSKLGSLTEYVRGDSEVSEGSKLSTPNSSEEDSHFKFSSMESDSDHYPQDGNRVSFDVKMDIPNGDRRHPQSGNSTHSRASTDFPQNHRSFPHDGNVMSYDYFSNINTNDDNRQTQGALAAPQMPEDTYKKELGGNNHESIEVRCLYSDLSIHHRNELRGTVFCQQNSLRGNSGQETLLFSSRSNAQALSKDKARK